MRYARGVRAGLRDEPVTAHAMRRTYHHAPRHKEGDKSCYMKFGRLAHTADHRHWLQSPDLMQRRIYAL